jgi:hypothetical protein
MGCVITYNIPLRLGEKIQAGFQLEKKSREMRGEILKDRW